MSVSDSISPFGLSLDKHVMAGLNDQTDVGQEPTAHENHILLNILDTEQHQ